VTTIVFKNGTLAADTALTSGADAHAGEMSKIAKCEDFMGGASGGILEVSKFLEWVVQGADFDDLPKFEEKFNAFLIDKTHKVRVVGKEGISHPIKSPFYAIGSGEEAAKGALLMGATAEEAVQAAIHVDLYTGGSVEALRFE